MNFKKYQQILIIGDSKKNNKGEYKGYFAEIKDIERNYYIVQIQANGSYYNVEKNRVKSI